MLKFKKIAIPIIALTAVLGFVVFKSNEAVSVNVCEEATVSGYGWSSNIGWVSFCGDNYGVEIDYDDNGKMSGYAWSRALGWISFNSGDLTGCPSAPCEARYDLSEDKLTGWAKVLDPEEWVSLEGSNYGISYSDGSLSGHSWGDVWTGWMSWEYVNASPYPKPEVYNLEALHPDDYCEESSPYVTLTWEYEGYTREYSGAWLKVGDDEVGEISPTTSYDYNNLDFDESYTWTVRVQNEDGVWSDEKSDTFTTDIEHPNPDFTWVPESPFAEDEVSFFDSDHNIITSWSWSFEGGSPSSSSTKDPEVVFSTEGEKEVTLEVSSGLRTCSLTKTVNVRPSLPDDWREVDPF